MGLRENEADTEHILERMENTMNNLEQMSYDSINITDRLVTLLSDAREHAAIMKTGTDGRSISTTYLMNCMGYHHTLT